MVEEGHAANLQVAMHLPQNQSVKSLLLPAQMVARTTSSLRERTLLNQQHQYPFNNIAFGLQLYVQLSVKLLSQNSMKGLNKGSWAPAPIVLLTLVPILILALLTYIAIKCTTWAPALRLRFQAWANRAWAKPSFNLGHKRKASDATGEGVRS